MEKKEIEELLKTEIPDSLFQEALEYAERKQKYIYSRNGNRAVMEHWYLAMLTEEYVRSLAFSQFTMDLCRALRDMEKEHSTKSQSAHQTSIL